MSVPGENALWQINARNYLNVAGITILCYDHLLTLDAEMLFCWSFSRAKNSYRVLILRYLSIFLSLGIFLWRMLPLPGINGHCILKVTMSQIQLIVVAVCVCVMLAIRVYQLYGRHRRVLIGFSLVAAIIVAFIAWAFVQSRKHPANAPFNTGCNASPLSAKSAGFIAIPWMCLLVFQILIFTLIVYKTYASARQGMRIGIAEPITFSSVFYKEGAVFVGIQAVTVLGAVLTFFTHGMYLRSFGVSVAISVSVAMTSRMFMHTYLTDAKTGMHPSTVELGAAGKDGTFPRKGGLNNLTSFFTTSR